MFEVTLYFEEITLIPFRKDEVMDVYAMSAAMVVAG